MEQEQATQVKPLDLSQLSIEKTLEEHDRRIGDMHEFDAFVCGMQLLPGQNPKRAIDIYTALAASEQGEHRQTAAILIPRLLTADRTVTLALWDKLVGDPDWDVRNNAYQSLWSGLQVDDDHPENDFELSSLDAGILTRTFYEAERLAAGVAEGESDERFHDESKQDQGD